jgi:hypothetical protein
MKIQIKLKFSDNVLFEGEYESLKHAVVDAVNKNTDLRDTNLRGTDLRGANLYGANLYGADNKIIDKIISVSQMFGIDGSGRQITIYFCEKDTWILAGCFFGTIKEFVAKAKSEDKMIYVKIVGDFVKLKRKQIKDKE